ncbi:hypothetical protein [Parahaliea mediterranea]|uniref:Lipoprotein n=1 Tax=Parahaliea mediterranea TaxID=651086 RepID=A0A939DKD2_9GAMM|nr:hypothetical protein [Parahaliea mediterranea]MBN7799017.1 hypothetical protein [Parahaliea mediterranea]
MALRFPTAVLSLGLTALLSACAGTSGDVAKQQVASNDAPETGPNAISCKSIIRTGTRIGTRVCKTNQQWEQEQRDSRAAAEAVQRGGAQTQTHAGSGT